jgi:THO complex subunit 1
MMISHSADREAQTEWALGIKNAIANYLQEGSDGKFYYRMVDTVLSRDKNWVRWKMENCHPFTRDRVPTTDTLGAKSGAQQAVRRSMLRALKESPGLEYMSSDGTEKGLVKLKGTDRYAPLVRLTSHPSSAHKKDSFTPPSAESYAKTIQMADLDLEMASTEEEKRQLEEKKSSNTWRGLRLASKNRLSSFDKPGKGLEPLQPGTSIEAAGEDNAPTAPEVRDSVPPQSVEEQRADQRSQVTAE